MSSSRRYTLSAAIVPILAVVIGLLSACKGGVGGSQVIIPDGCGVTQTDLQGTWVISHVIQNLSCPAGSTLVTTAAPDSFAPVTVVRDETLPGFKITATGLTATVMDVTCHITWTYLDQATHAQYECFTTFHPSTRTAGGTVEAGHCDQVTLIKNDGTPGTTCSIPLPYLDTFIVVQGS